MLHDKNNTQNLEDFYNALNENQKSKVEKKLKSVLRESINSLPQLNISAIRHQIAQDMYQILKG